ncbi:MAG: glycosyltransferase family 2 protein, partial [Paracoccaceae bacterium]
LFAPPGRDHYALAQLNHHALGAIESYLLKIDRGRANREDGPLGMDYWVERNWCDVEDQTISALAPARAREQAALMADPELARLHHAAVAWRHRRIDALMRDDGMRALFGRLVITPPARVIDPVLARHIYHYARKAQGRGR